MRLRQVAGIGLILTALGAAGCLADEPPAGYADFLAARDQYAAALTQPISACVARADTGNPVFHGCIDWHSAVHGTWALVAYTWATGDSRYRAFIDKTLDPAGLAQERQHLRADPHFEMPYGRAWFLRLAIDHHRAFHSELLRPMADDVAASLQDYYTRNPPQPLSFAYDNASWALINLYDYGVATGNRKLTDFVLAEVKAHYLDPGPCPVQMEVSRPEFMAVCTNWAWLVQLALPADQFRPWLDRFLPGDPPLTPVVQATTAHQHGLNFSRAWGLWRLYRTSGEARFWRAYQAHFQQTYTHPDDWKGDYHTVAHWVAQFGMFALMVSYYDVPPAAPARSTSAAGHV